MSGTQAPASSGLLRLCVALFALNCAWRALLALSFPVFYKEAYFWEWSRFPSLGYLDHPPMVAWVIGAFTSVLGDRSPLALRAGALVFGTGTLLLIYRLAFQLFHDRTVALRALLLALCLPGLNVLGVIMLPDGPLLFFHLLALSLFVSALRGGRGRAWYLAGLALGLALLSKLMAVLTVLALAWLLVISPSQRFWLKRKEPYLALVLAAVVASPFLYWNLTHEWASFRLQLWERHEGTLGPSLLKTGEFLFEQLANTSVFLAVPLLGCLAVRAASVPEPWRPWYRLLRCQSVVVLVFFLLAGTITETHPHWTVLAYPTAAIALAALWTSPTRPVLTRGLAWGIALAKVTLIGGVGLALAGLPLLAHLPPERFDGPIARGLRKGRVLLLDRPDLERQLDPFLAQASPDGRAPLFAYGYRRASPLSFHRQGPPVINLAAYLRGGRKIGDGQWYYLPVERLQGKSGILVTDADWITRGYLLQVFEVVDELGTIESRYAGRIIQRYRVLRVVRLKVDAIRRLHPPPAR